MIRIALIGCDHATGDYGQLASRLQGARLVAVVDPRGALARRTAEALEVPLWAASFEDLLRDHADAFDAVVIRRPSGSPQSVVARAARAGKHVLLDMPLLLRTRAGDAPIAACRSAGVTFMLGQVTRFLPSVAEVRSCLASGILGAPGLLRIHDWRPPDMDQQTPSGPEQADTAAAAVLQAVLPDVDLANWIFGDLPTEVYAAGHAGPGVPRGPCGYVQVHLGYTDGGMALVDHSMMLPPGSSYFSVSVFGSAGAAYADDHHNMHLLYRGGRPTALPAGQGSLHHLAELQEFIEVIETGRPPAIGAEDGHKAAEVVRAAARSLESGRAMQFVGCHYELI
jgi:predicted dehydrogenase